MPSTFSLALILFALLNLFSPLIVSAAPVEDENTDVAQVRSRPRCTDVTQRREWYVYHVLIVPKMH